MYGMRFNRKDSRAASYEVKARKRDLCRIYGHTPGKIRAGNNLFCSVCGKRFCAN